MHGKRNSLLDVTHKWDVKIKKKKNSIYKELNYSKLSFFCYCLFKYEQNDHIHVHSYSLLIEKQNALIIKHI